MKKYYLAVDIGASSGRHILGYMQDGRMQIEEICRFSNGMVKRDGERCWEMDRLYQEILKGMKKCREIGKLPVSMGVDTWGVDFVLLDKQDRILGNTVGYRDKRTNGMDDKVYETISQDELYRRTGIQKAIFNTIYQLMAVKEKHPEYMDAAETLLFVPDYFHYCLTGQKVNEYTEATTGQLVSPVTKDWDYELIDMLGYNRRMFQKMVIPGTDLGELTPKAEKEVGYNLHVVEPATHDTGSAVLAVPAEDDDFIYISSGTWSLMGIERKEADCSLESCRLNLTNEGGYDYRFRYLKNIMGLWMIQSVRHEYEDAYDFAEICELAAKAKDFPSRVDVNDQRFLAPDNMTEEIKAACRESGQQVPESLGETAAVIYASLAQCYAKTAEELEKMAGRTFSRIHIVGGGANAGYLNQLTADASGKEVHAGPMEATAIGNLAAQMLKAKEFSSVEEVRAVIHRSFDVKIYKPQRSK
jgi:rhamnulokinase